MPTNTPIPIGTAVPTNIPVPTFTPVVSLTPWLVTIRASQAQDDVIPPLQNTYPPCIPDPTDPNTRLPCAIKAYNEYRLKLGGAMTWGQFASLVMESEGGLIILNGGNPQTSGLGICWRVTDIISTDVATWNEGENQCNVSSNTAPGIQNDFVYAVWEWIFNECSKATGFAGNYQNYQGECNELGFVNFLSQVQTLYQDTTYAKDPNKYLALARSEFSKWGWYGGNLQRYRYGICPCTWGNVKYEKTSDVPANLDKERAARRNDGRSYNNGWSFSYFAWKEANAPDPNNRYFKVY
jgi:hypothetical protein